MTRQDGSRRGLRTGGCRAQCIFGNEGTTSLAGTAHCRPPTSTGPPALGCSHQPARCLQPPCLPTALLLSTCVPARRRAAQTQRHDADASQLLQAYWALRFLIIKKPSLLPRTTSTLFFLMLETRPYAQRNSSHTHGLTAVALEMACRTSDVERSGDSLRQRRETPAVPPSFTAVVAVSWNPASGANFQGLTLLDTDSRKCHELCVYGVLLDQKRISLYDSMIQSCIFVHELPVGKAHGQDLQVECDQAR